MISDAAISISTSAGRGHHGRACVGRACVGRSAATPARSSATMPVLRAFTSDDDGALESRDRTAWQSSRKAALARS